MAGPSLSQQLAEALAANEALRVEIVALQAETESLRDQVAALKAALSADSSTTSKPPSGDPVGARKKRAERRAEAREAAKRSQGKQPGAPGSNLARRRADRVIGHEPPACGYCGADLTGAPVVGSEVRQVIDLPRVTPTVTDHVTYKRRCSCGAVTAGTMPPEARAAVCWGRRSGPSRSTCSTASTCRWSAAPSSSPTCSARRCRPGGCATSRPRRPASWPRSSPR